MTEKILNERSNWETIVFLYLNDFLGGDYRVFLRKQFLSSENVDSMVKWAERLGHKKHPKSPIETLQNTIQGMKAKGYMDFVPYSGEWKLTKKGYDKMLETVQKHQDLLNELDGFMRELDMM
jgi:hypothetical protein